MIIEEAEYAHVRVLYPVRHRRKVPFNPSILAPPRFAERMLELQGLDRELDRFVIPRRDILKLASDAFSSNIHFSSKVEGNPLTLEEVSRVASDPFRGRVPEPLDESEREIVNHLIAFLDPQVFALPWSLDKVAEVHAILMGGLGEVAIPGMLRTSRSSVVSDQGQETFVTCPPEHIKEEMESLLNWLNASGPALHPIVAASIFFHEFESIHPFDDGNGRTGRVLFHGYLQTHGLGNVNACKVEAELLQDPEFYYRVLGWTDQSGQYQEFLDFVTDALSSAYHNAVQSFREKDVLATGSSETTRRILEMARHETDWFSAHDATLWVPNVSEQTIRNHLNILVRKEVLESTGKTRAKVYRFSASLRTALEFVRQYARPVSRSQAQAAAPAAERGKEEHPP
jgi:Fic family protein